MDQSLENKKDKLGNQWLNHWLCIFHLLRRSTKLLTTKGARNRPMRNSATTNTLKATKLTLLEL
jgi:hypothetical protein